MSAKSADERRFRRTSTAHRVSPATQAGLRPDVALQSGAQQPFEHRSICRFTGNGRQPRGIDLQFCKGIDGGLQQVCNRKLRGVIAGFSDR